MANDLDIFSELTKDDKRLVADIVNQLREYFLFSRIDALLLTRVDGKGKLLRCEDGNISERSAEYG